MDERRKSPRKLNAPWREPLFAPGWAPLDARVSRAQRQRRDGAFPPPVPAPVPAPAQVEFDLPGWSDADEVPAPSDAEEERVPAPRVVPAPSDADEEEDVPAPGVPAPSDEEHVPAPRVVPAPSEDEEEEVPVPSGTARLCHAPICGNVRKGRSRYCWKHNMAPHVERAARDRYNAKRRERRRRHGAAEDADS